MGDNHDKVFVGLYWGNTKDSRLEWALDHFDKDKTQLMIFHHCIYNYSEKGYQNRTKSYWLPRCAEKNFKVEVLIPAADEVGGDYTSNLRKIITRHGINKLVTDSYDLTKNTISKVFNDAPHLSCKVWFIDYNKGKLHRTRWYNPSHAQMMEEALVENENLQKKINEKTSQCKKLEEELFVLEEIEHGIGNLAEFSHDELKEATNDFNAEYMIGKGGYSVVYKGVVRCTPVAIKVLNNESGQGETEFNAEVKALQKVRHPNLVTLIGTCRDIWALVYEFLPKGNLDDCLTNAEHRKSLSWRKRIEIASNICSALVFLHQTKPHGIVHGDLKPANILLDSAYTCKISDFGTCRRLNLTDTTTTPYHETEDQKGTICYFDPEYTTSGRITPQSDVFAFGMVLLQLVTGRKVMAIKMLVEEALEEKNFDEVVDSLANWPLEVAEKIARLGLKCIQWSRKDRPDLVKEVWVTIKSMESFAAPL